MKPTENKPIGVLLKGTGISADDIGEGGKICMKSGEIKGSKM